MISFFLILAGTLLSATGFAASELPSAQVTRYLSPGGIEHINLRCVATQKAAQPYSCQVIRERNGNVLSTVSMTPAEVTHSLKRYFKKVPKEEVSRVGHAPAEKWEQKSNMALVWSVSSGEMTTKGSAPYARDLDSESLLAILSLEMDLATQGIGN